MCVDSVFCLFFICLYNKFVFDEQNKTFCKLSFSAECTVHQTKKLSSVHRSFAIAQFLCTCIYIYH